MDAKNAINQILHDATGKRASGRELLMSEKRSILSPAAAKALKEQWNGAGRDNALVIMKLVDESGLNPHYVTGWDGKETFVCMTESGLTYVPYRKLEKMTFVEAWNSETRLIEVRTPLLRESMERADVNMLLDRVKKTLVKSGKGRRKSRFKNLSKYFESDCASKTKSPGPPSETEMEPLDKKDERAPKAKPFGLKKESFAWDAVDANGSVVRRRFRHPKLSEANTTEPQLDKRQQVSVRGEGGAGGSATGGAGNKSEPQFDKRQQIDVRQESNTSEPQLDKRQQVDVRHEACTGCGCNGAKFVTYAGEHGTCPECGARQLVDVRHEALNISKKAKKLFGADADKKAPSGKPLLMFVLMKKGKGAKKPMSEATTYCPRCGASHADSDHPKSKFGPMKGLMGRPTVTPEGGTVHNCPGCAAKEATLPGGLRLKVEMPKKPKMPKSDKPNNESLSRSSLKTVEESAHRFFPGRPDLAEKHGHKFLANMMKFKAKAAARKSKAS